MSMVHGVVIGIVKQIDKELGRVRVNMPCLDDENKTYWARVASFMGGKDRGAWFMPELEDEVLLAFEMGDVDHPHVIGFPHSQVDKPPIEDSSIDEHVRRFRSVKKHYIDFDDRDGQEKIFMQSKSEHQFQLNDADKYIELKTNGNRSIKLSDQDSEIDIKTAGDPEITLNDQSPKVTIKAGSPDPSVVLDGTGQSVKITMGQNSVTVDQTGVSIQASGTVSITVTGSLSITGSVVSIQSQGPLSLQGAAVTLTASSVLSVTAPFTSFSGPVQTTSLISPLYTPGAGNLI